MFRNGDDSLTWQNPFTAGVVGAASGQLALAPDNQFHQLLASAGYAISPARARQRRGRRRPHDAGQRLTLRPR